MPEPLRFQHYEVARKPDGSPLELGRGAMGITYRAFDTNLRADVALKVISGAYLNSDVARDRFLREARAAAAIRHPNVATVFHLGEAEDSYFYAMEFVDGETVEKYMRREGALPTLSALDVASQVARALQAAQKQGLVHRDIKPSNVMLTRDEDDDLHVKVIDFGLAKTAANSSEDGADAATLTMGGFLGTPHFASPEQLDERELDVRSDIYSLGVTLFYMLAGEVPFGGSLARTISRQLHHSPPWEKLDSQPEPVRDLVGRMMAKDPAERIATPVKLRRAIDECIATIERDNLKTPGATKEVAPLSDTETESIDPPDFSDPQVGQELGGRYDLLEEIAATPLGRRFRAKSHETEKVVGIIVVDPTLLPTVQARNRFEDEISALQGIDHPGLLRIDGVEDVPPLTWLTHEWVEGPTLLDEIRGRGPLAPARTANLIKPIAGALDALADANLSSPTLTPAAIRLPSADAEPRINPLTPDTLSALSKKATLAGTSIARLRATGAITNDPGAESAFALAGVAYEMLSGIRPPAPGRPFVPIPGLPKPAEAALRSGLDPKNTFKSASNFADRLAKALTANPRAASAASNLTTAAAGKPTTPASDSDDSPARDSEPINAVDEREVDSPPSITRPIVLAGAAALVLVLLAMIVSALSGDDDADAQPEPTPGISVTDPTPAAPEPTPNPEPTPDPADAAIVLADDHAAVGDYSAAFATLSDLDPADPAVAEATASLATRLRNDTRFPDLADLLPFEENLRGAAATGSSDATYLLARIHDQRGEATEAFPLYDAAAAAGDPLAMTKVGAAHAAGWGTPQNWPLAIEWFEKAADAGDPAAYYALGECYALGKGVEKNPAKAFEYLDLAARAYEQTLAQILLADLYLNGTFGEPNYFEAYRLFRIAADAGSLDAQAKIGVMIYNGQVIDGGAVSKKPKPSESGYRQAFEIFAEGAKANNPLSLYYHGRLLETGTGTDEKDPDTAREEITRAARLGNKEAIRWCRENDVPIAEPTPAPENPTLDGQAPSENPDPESLESAAPIDSPDTSATTQPTEEVQAADAELLAEPSPTDTNGNALDTSGIPNRDVLPPSAPPTVEP
ncbi:MAG: protein kinase [Chthoniobacterales bacterium]